MNIAFVIDAIESSTAGTEQQLLALLSNLDRSRFTPFLCVFRESHRSATPYQCPVHVIGISSFKTPSALLRIVRLARYFRRMKIDVVQTFFKDGNKVGILAGVLAGVRVIISSRRTQGYWITRTELLILKVLDKFVHLVIANSLSTREWVKLVEGVPESKIRVIYNGIDLSAFHPASPEERTRLRSSFAIPLSAVVFGIVANLRPVKGHEILMRAAQIVKQALPSACFVLVGEGELVGTLRQRACDLDIADSVKFLGARQDVPQVLQLFDIGILSSHSESFSNVILEYMAAGLPVVCTDVGGAREVVEDGVNGFVVPAGDSQAMAARLIALANDQDVAARGRRNQAKVRELYSMSKMVTQYEAIYDSFRERS